MAHLNHILTLSERNCIALSFDTAATTWEHIARTLEEHTSNTIDRKIIAHLKEAAKQIRRRQARMMRLYEEIQPEEIPAILLLDLITPDLITQSPEPAGPKPNDSGTRKRRRKDARKLLKGHNRR